MLYPQFIESLDNQRNLFLDALAKVSVQHEHWDLFEDARITIFTKIISDINYAYLGLEYIEYSITREYWWRKRVASWPSEGSPEWKQLQMRVKNMTNIYDMGTKNAFIQGVFSGIESSLRIYCRKLDASACNNGTAEFKNIYTHLLKQLELGATDYQSLLDLLRHIRNTIHNNGIYYHKSMKNAIIDYKGIGYKFEIGKPMEHGGWDFLINLLTDVKAMVVDIVTAKKLATYSEVRDPLMEAYYKAYPQHRYPKSAL